MKYFFLFLILPVICFAQKQQRENYIYYNIGSGFSNFGTPFYLNFEIGPMYPKWTQRLSIGEDISYRHFQEPVNSTFYKHKIIGFIPYINYHILKVNSKSDLYFGLGFGVFFMSPKPMDTINYPSAFFNLAPQIGFRYFITKSIGFNVEWRTYLISNFNHTNLFEARAGLTINLPQKK